MFNQQAKTQRYLVYNNIKQRIAENTHIGQTEPRE